MSAMDLLKKNKLLFGISVCYTSQKGAIRVFFAQADYVILAHERLPDRAHIKMGAHFLARCV